MVNTVAIEKRRHGTKLKKGERGRAQKRFLKKFAKDANLAMACRYAGISRSTVYRWIDGNIDGFAPVYKEAEEDAKDAIRAEIYRRGVTGWKEPVFYKGMKVESIRKFSDTLLIFEAKRRMPDYRDSPQAIAEAKITLVKVGGKEPRTVQELTTEELEVAYKELGGEEDA